jgi:hypothetical protein
MYLKITAREYVKWIGLTQEMIQWLIPYNLKFLLQPHDYLLLKEDQVHYV